MMKKLLPIGLFLLFLSTLTHAQEKVFDYSRAYSDYLYNLNLYRQSHTEYIAAREAYLRYKTLTSKTNALEKTLKMAQDRAEVIRTYLTALRLKLSQTTGISSYDQNILYLKLDGEVGWYQKHHGDLPSAATLEDLVNLSEKAEDEYLKTEVLIYQTLQTILVGKETNLKDKLSGQIELLKEKLNQIREKGDKDPSLAERWVLEAENRLVRSQEKLLASQQILAKIKPSDINKSQRYYQAQLALEESHQYLKEASRYLKEVIREIKSAD